MNDVHSWVQLVKVWKYCSGYITALSFNDFCARYYRYDEEKKGYRLVGVIGEE